MRIIVKIPKSYQPEFLNQFGLTRHIFRDYFEIDEKAYISALQQDIIIRKIATDPQWGHVEVGTCSRCGCCANWCHYCGKTIHNHSSVLCYVKHFCSKECLIRYMEREYWKRRKGQKKIVWVAKGYHYDDCHPYEEDGRRYCHCLHGWWEEKEVWEFKVIKNES